MNLRIGQDQDNILYILLPYKKKGLSCQKEKGYLAEHVT